MGRVCVKILIVDDEPEIVEHLTKALVEQRYIVESAQDGEEAQDKIFDAVYDLIILDIMLPGIDGLTILREMRRAGINTPVLMLTARDSLEDKITGLDRGADDYLAKPFSIYELMARIRALLRRVGDNNDPVLRAGKVALDTIGRLVTSDGAPVALTPREFSILEFLLYNKNRVISRFNLAEHVWGDDFDPFTMSNFIDVHIKNIRKKTGDKHIIKTIRGVGFVVEDAPREDGGIWRSGNLFHIRLKSDPEHWKW